MKEKGLVLQEEHFYELLSFLISSAYLLSQGEEFEELYSSVRMMDAACRLTNLALLSGGFEDESWPRLFSNECERGLELMSKDNDAFIEFLQESTLMITKEMKTREGD